MIDPIRTLRRAAAVGTLLALATACAHSDRVDVVAGGSVASNAASLGACMKGENPDIIDAVPSTSRLSRPGAYWAELTSWDQLDHTTNYVEAQVALSPVSPNVPKALPTKVAAFWMTGDGISAALAGGQRVIIQIAPLGAEPAYADVAVAIDTDGAGAFIGECEYRLATLPISSRLVGHPLGQAVLDYATDPSTSLLSARLFPTPVPTTGKPTKFNGYDIPVGSVDPETQPSVMRQAIGLTLRITVPPSWADSTLVVCSSIDAGWNECTPLTRVDLTSAIELESRFLPTSPSVAIWLVQNNQVYARLGTLDLAPSLQSRNPTVDHVLVGTVSAGSQALDELQGKAVDDVSLISTTWAQ